MQMWGFSVSGVMTSHWLLTINRRPLTPNHWVSTFDVAHGIVSVLLGAPVYLAKESVYHRDLNMNNPICQAMCGGPVYQIQPKSWSSSPFTLPALYISVLFHKLGESFVGKLNQKVKLWIEEVLLVKEEGILSGGTLCVGQKIPNKLLLHGPLYHHHQHHLYDHHLITEKFTIERSWNGPIWLRAAI